MDTPQQTPHATQQPVDGAKKRREKYARYYQAHRDVLREKAHKRYFSRVHNLDEPPPLRTNLRVAVP
jgi:hypothetical protein